MSTESTRKFMERYIAAIETGSKSQVIDEYIADEALKQHIATFEAAFPDYRLDVHDMLVDGDRAALRVTFSGVHMGDFQGVAATSRAVTVPLMLFYRVENDKIVQFWINADSLGLLQQLGAAPVPA